MDKLSEKQLKVLNDTITHFNSTNRSKNMKGCQYVPAHTNTEGCAIGRLIQDKELCEELDKFGHSGVANDDVFNLLPTELKELGQGFLIMLQNLHDSANNWNEDGLSEVGEYAVQRIKDSIKNKNFLKYIIN